ncbi:MAG: DUF2142 domain-containing protein [Saprospiraceae bacterium]|nr:DUF2142 domain-containing protein [Saprospiraceae bacterium]
MKLPSPTRFFLFTALWFGLLLVVLTPPFQSPDEYNHFFRACQVSEGQWRPECPAANRLGGTLPAALDTLKTIFLPLKGRYEARVAAMDMKQALAVQASASSRVFLDFPNTAIYAPVAYLPQALGIGIARLLTDRVLLWLYAARLFNLMFWLSLVGLAIRSIPFYQWVLAGLALLPASLAIAASCNADVLSNGLAFWVIAVCCRPLAETSGWAAVLVLALNKLVLAPFALLLRFRQAENWKSALRRALLPAALALATAAAWGSLANDWFIPYDRYDIAVRDQQTLNPGVDPGGQLAYVLGHPMAFARTVLGSALRAFPSMCAHVVGKFGWEKNYLPAWLIGALWLALLALVGTSENPLSGLQRSWVVGICLLSLILWALTMYALWCPVGAPALDNWQGRYFVPLLPLVAMGLGRAPAGLPQGFRSLAAGLLLLGNAMLLVSLFQRYYTW